MNSVLSPDQINQYHDKGYLVPDYQLPDDLLKDMKDEYQVLLDNNKHVESDFMLSPHLDKPGAQGVIGPRKWLEFATHSDLLEMAT